MHLNSSHIPQFMVFLLLILSLMLLLSIFFTVMYIFYQLTATLFNAILTSTRSFYFMTLYIIFNCLFFIVIWYSVFIHAFFIFHTCTKNFMPIRTFIAFELAFIHSLIMHFTSSCCWCYLSFYLFTNNKFTPFYLNKSFIIFALLFRFTYLFFN